LREEHRLRAFENRGLRGILGPKRDKMIGGWRKLHNEELHNLYSSPSTIRIMNSWRMGLAGHVARMGRRGIHVGSWWESQRERDHYKDLDLSRRIILKWILEKEDGVVLNGFIWLGIRTGRSVL
jgi:hypothetical protein